MERQISRRDGPRRDPDKIASARTIHPWVLEDGVAGSCCARLWTHRNWLPLGDVRTPRVADLFVAIMSSRREQAQGAMLMTSSGMWIGSAVNSVFLFAALRLRRSRGSI